MTRDVYVLQLLLFLLPPHVQTEPAAECAPGGHSLLNQPYRSTTFRSSWLQQSSLHQPLCDHSLAPGWYQFQLFNKPASMPTSCVQVNHCGTQAPVWLSLSDGQTLPRRGEVRHLTACASWQSQPGSPTDCCMFRLPVSVRNCGTFYVYLLQPTQGCMAYCAEEMSDSSLSCSPDSEESDGTCQTKQPPVPSSVTIVPEAKGSAVFLRCSFEIRSDTSVGFNVAWSRLSVLGHREELKRETTLHTSAVIELDGFNLRLGDKIYCSSSSFFLDSPDVHSPSLESPEFFAGITLRPEVSTVPEDGRLYEVVFESTVPVLCLRETTSPKNCTLRLEIATNSQDSESLAADLSLSSCAVDLGSAPCSDGTCGRAVVHFSPITDFIVDDNRTTDISVKPIISENVLWNGYAPEMAQITVTDVPAAYCYSFTDPHTITFDGRSYENSQIGTFVLFRSSLRPLEIHVRQWECGSVEHVASCVCGFVVRDGADVIAFDMCNGELGETKPRLHVKNKGLGKSSIRITESYQGRKLTMSLSSGAFVRADVSSWGMSVTVRASGAERGHTRGLCGTYDGNIDNDFHSNENVELLDIHNFISAWRLPPGSSLFDSVPPPSLSTTNPKKFCNCQTKPPPSSNGAKKLPNQENSCSHWGNVLISSLIPVLDVTAEYITAAELKTDSLRQKNLRYRSHPQRQSLNQSDSQDLGVLAYFFPEDHEPSLVPPDSPPTWPTHSGMGLDQAQAQCRAAVAKSSVALGCRQLLPKAVVDRAVDMCVSDLQLKDDESWLNGTLPLLENECERRLMEQRSTEEYPEVLAILRCPSLCHGNGQCSEWGCVCFPGFGSYDCSSLSDQIPEISEVEGGGLCDVRQSDCSSVRVFGLGFRDSYELKCEFVKEKFVSDEWILDEPVFSLASFLDATALECRFPPEDSQNPPGAPPQASAAARRPLSRWQIRVSNDGYSFSNSKIVTLFDGLCQMCSADVLCSLRVNTCFIDGVCFGDGEISPSSSCLTCRPQSTPYAWSTAEKNKPPLFQSLPSALSSFQGQTLTVQLQAQDPEGSAVVFRLDSGPSRSAVSPSGLLTWRTPADAVDTHTFRVTVTDQCQAHSSTALQVSVFSCSCLNGGSCVSLPLFPPVAGEHRCVCPQGFRGRRCEEDVDDCKPNPCRYGRCIDAPNAFSCICPAGTTGHTCREDVDECLSQPCFPGVSCNNTLGSFSCGLCPEGFTGDGKTCSRGAPASPRLRPSPCARSPCHPGVQCFESVHVAAGFVCGPCPHGLHGNGRICRRTNQATVSVRAERLNALTPTSASSFRKHRKPRPKDSGLQRRPSDRTHTPTLTPTAPRGQPSGTQLTPDRSAEGQRASCPSGYTGDGVTCKAVCRFACGHNMECTLPNTCSCKDGFTGYSCHIAVCRPDCKNQGRCVRPNVCECPTGYNGSTCEQAHCEPPCHNGGTCAARNHCTCPYGYVGPRCEIMVCSRHCENGGECVAPDVCRCEPGWNGPTCASASCDPLCVNGGTCIKPNVCVCPRGFYGSHCQIALCSPPCKNGGQCIRSNVCSCPSGYSGKRCQRSVCEPMCINGGKCVGPNSCSCASGWSGARCNIPVCLQSCKNDGECIGPNTCQCPLGWDGLQCQSPVCRQPCLNGGRCVLPDYCHCRKGFKGLTCAMKAAK